MSASEIEFDLNDLRNIGDQYCGRLLQAKAGLPATMNGMGIQEAFIADNPGLDPDRVKNMLSRKSIPHEYLIKFEVWAEKIKMQLQAA